MAKTYQYCVAENWGKGFIDHVESQRITFASFPGNVGKFLHTTNTVIFGLLKLQVLLKQKTRHRRLLMQRFKQHKLRGMLYLMLKKHQQ